jgi:predicted DNA-binding protein (MmcQ/YjbR family)
MPYGEDWVVFRIGGKIYLHIWLKAPIPTIAVKLLPERGEELREEYNAFLRHTICARSIGMTFLLRGLFPTT